MIIYKATNLINNKVYIGKTIRPLENRIKSHLYNSKKANCIFANAINKYSIEGFKWEIICKCNTIEELHQKEIYWIQQYDSQDLTKGYNMTSGGERNDTLRNHPNKKQILEKISISNKKFWSKFKGQTYEQIYGEKTGSKLRQQRIDNNIMNRKTVFECWVDRYGIEKAKILEKNKNLKLSKVLQKQKYKFEDNIKQKILQLYNNQNGLTVTEIAKKLNITRYKIKVFLIQQGFKGYGLELSTIIKHLK